jgi:hypothetical protein
MTPPPIPEPRLQTVRHGTPFRVFHCDKMGPGRRFFDTVVLKGTFVLSPGVLTLAEEQADLALADEAWDLDAPERSSLKHAGEVVLTKPGTDVLVTGTARPAGSERLPTWDVEVAVRRAGQAVLGYRAQVLGPRVWRHRAGGWALTDPDPTDAVPLRYELAYGGAYPGPAPASGEAAPPFVVHQANPSGTGFFDEAALDPGADYRAPQWQPHAQPVTGINREVPLTGLGPVARPWSARLAYAGTYDAAWERATRADVERGLPADYAADFDPRFFQCAHPALIAPTHLEGDEELVLTGLLPGAAPFVTRLPGRRLTARLRDGAGGWHTAQMRLDTVHLDVDARTASLCWRLTLDQARDVRMALIHETEEA